MLLNLEAMRGLCAVWVALAHARWPTHGASLLLENSWLPVNFFFVLSGFIMARTYAAKPAFDARAFMVKRFWRLYPLHFMTTLLFLAFVIIRQYVLPGATGRPPSATMAENLWLHTLLNLGLLHAMGTLPVGLLNSPSWSISTEFWTYAMFMLCCVSTKHPAVRAGAMAVIGGAALIALLALTGDHGQLETIRYGFLRCVAAFGLGCLTWLLVTRWPPRLTPAATSFAMTALLAALATLLWGPRGAGGIPSDTLATLLIAPVIALAAVDSGSIFKRALETPVLVALGTWSYSIYMVHMLIAVLFLRLTEPLGLTAAQGDVLTLVYLATVIAASAATYRWIEQPWRVGRVSEV
jgi:peptidoglycan/LPS O-acetylase OafA/YrhL